MLDKQPVETPCWKDSVC